MTKRYEIYAFGIEDGFEVDYLGGGWTLATASFDKAEAEKCRDALIAKIGEDNVDWNF